MSERVQIPVFAGVSDDTRGLCAPVRNYSDSRWPKLRDYEEFARLSMSALVP